MTGKFDYDEFVKIKETYQEWVTNKKALERLDKSLKAKLAESEILLSHAEKARIVIQEVARLTQENLRFRISNLVTTALLSIRKDWPEFEMAIESRRNQSEIDFFFVEDGQLQDPLESNGYGVVDVAATALNISVWSLNKNRPVFIKDEPFKHLSKDNSKAASKMLKMLCDKLGIQIIMVSHDQEITDHADKIFRVSKKSLISQVRQE